jgi:hypothetical protein
MNYADFSEVLDESWQNQLMTPLAGRRSLNWPTSLAGHGRVSACRYGRWSSNKVEAPEGNAAWGRRSMADGERSAYFSCGCNRGKKESVVIDFRTVEAKAALLRLLADADADRNQGGQACQIWAGLCKPA